MTLMSMRAGTRRRVALFLRALRGTVVIGALFGSANGFPFRDAPLLGVLLGALGGATNGVILVGAIFGAEIFLAPTRLGHTDLGPQQLRGRAEAMHVYAVTAKPPTNAEKTI